MRLRSCVFVELFLGMTLLVAGVLGSMEALDWARSRLARDAKAAAPRASEKPRLDEGELETARSVGLFLGVSDDVLLEPLRDSPIKEIKYNRGGSSISLRIDFENGARAAWKPVQLTEHTVPRFEVAAFRMNRLLGLASVPPATGRRFKAQDLYDKMRDDSRVFLKRMREEMTIESGMVPGTMSWWIPVIAIAKVDGHPIDTAIGVATWTRYLTVGQPIAHADVTLTRQISDLVVFDFVIDNVDRWSGGNVRMSEDGRVLYFMDNTAAFGTGRPGAGRTRAYLHRSQKFSRQLISSLEALTEQRVRAALTPDGDAFSTLLSDDEIAAIFARRDFVLDYVANLISTHGREAVMVFP